MNTNQYDDDDLIALEYGDYIDDKFDREDYLNKRRQDEYAQNATGAGMLQAQHNAENQNKELLHNKMATN